MAREFRWASKAAWKRALCWGLKSKGAEMTRPNKAELKAQAAIKERQRIKYTRMLTELNLRAERGTLTREQRAMIVVLKHRLKELDK